MTEGGHGEAEAEPSTILVLGRSGCSDVTEFIARATTYICLKKVRAKDMIRSQIETSAVSESIFYKVYNTE